MAEVTSYCGLLCRTCPIYLATRQEDKAEQARARAEIARQCREQYGLTYQLEDITDCDGCRAAGGRLFSGCLKCPIRKCAREKGVENCAHCADYACAELNAFFATDPAAKTRLDEIRKTLQ